jgi:hypothetical protein
MIQQHFITRKFYPFKNNFYMTRINTTNSITEYTSTTKTHYLHHLAFKLLMKIIAETQKHNIFVKWIWNLIFFYFSENVSVKYKFNTMRAVM